MISIIISSINNSLLKQVTNNIKNTIGVPYEIISYNNSIQNYGICKVYNICAKKAKYKFLVFCHEDILFHTINWGAELITLLSNIKNGLIGAAGATYKSEFCTPWTSVPHEFYRMNAIQRYTNGNIIKHSINPKNEVNSKVAVIDGFFMATTKKIFKEIHFDEEYLKGFHLYDIDYSYKISKKYNILISHKILIEHFSQGNMNKNWFKESIRWHKRHKHYLPITIDNQTNIDKDIISVSAWKSIFLYCFTLNYNYLLMFKSLFQILYIEHITRNSITFIKFFISFTLGIPKIKKLWK